MTDTHQQSILSRSRRKKPQNLTLPWHPWSLRLQVAPLWQQTLCHPPMIQTSAPPQLAHLTLHRPGWFLLRNTRTALLCFYLNIYPFSLRNFVTTTMQTWSCSYASTAASSPLLSICTQLAAPRSTVNSMWWPSQRIPQSMSMVCCRLLLKVVSLVLLPVIANFTLGSFFCFHDRWARV